MRKKNPIMTQLHYQIQLQSGLMKECWKSVYKVHNKPDDHVVMQYLANSTVAEDFPYGNSKKPVNFLPSAKSLTTAMADKVTSLCSLQVATASEPEQFQPRNAQQKKYFERKSEVSADNFLVLHELAYMLPGFIWQISTVLDLAVFFGALQFFSLLDSGSSVLLTYDMTFNLGDFSVTTVVMHTGMFEDRPIFPVAFMLHERKFQRIHEDFCTDIVKRLPNSVYGQSFNICSDSEAACSNAIKKAFPQWNIFNCCNHILRDVEFWLKKHGGSKEETTLYKIHNQDILKSRTPEEYSMAFE